MRLNLPWLKLLAIALPVAAVLLLFGCTPSHPQSTFDPAGPVAEKQRDLFYIIFWVAMAVFILVEGILVYAVIRYRRKRGQEEIPTQTHGSTPLEIGWTIAPTVVLAVIAVPTIIYIFDFAKAPPPGSLEVNVTGHQWWWEFEYPDQKVVTANELHIPVNKQVKFNLRSDDVIHSFWVPKLAGKLDVIPGNENWMQFTAEETGIFYGQCAEFCGIAHAQMRLRVFVDTQEGFDAWVAKYHEIAARHAPTRETEEAKGAALFASRGCLLCHTANGPAPIEVRRSLKAAFEAGAPAFPAPNLTNFGARSTMAAGIIERNRQSVMKWLRDPDAIKPGNRMARLANVYTDPAARLTDEEISALATYLLSLK